MYVQRELPNGYEYIVAEPVITDGDVSADWGPQSEAMPFDEMTAQKWAALFGCGVTLFAAVAPIVEEKPKVSADEARRARVAAHLAAPELNIVEAVKRAEEASKKDDVKGGER